MSRVEAGLKDPDPAVRARRSGGGWIQLDAARSTMAIAPGRYRPMGSPGANVYDSRLAGTGAGPGDSALLAR